MQPSDCRLVLANFWTLLQHKTASGTLHGACDMRRLGSLFFMLLYLSMISLSSLPVWRDEKLLFIRCCSCAFHSQSCLIQCRCEGRQRCLQTFAKIKVKMLFTNSNS